MGQLTVGSQVGATVQRVQVGAAGGAQLQRTVEVNRTGVANS